MNFKGSSEDREGSFWQALNGEANGAGLGKRQSPPRHIYSEVTLMVLCPGKCPLRPGVAEIPCLKINKILRYRCLELVIPLCLEGLKVEGEKLWEGCSFGQALFCALQSMVGVGVGGCAILTAYWRQAPCLCQVPGAKGGSKSISKGGEVELSGCLTGGKGGTQVEISKSQDN